jgi:hypothetical protein
VQAANAIIAMAAEMVTSRRIRSSLGEGRTLCTRIVKEVHF